MRKNFLIFTVIFFLSSTFTTISAFAANSTDVVPGTYVPVLPTVKYYDTDQCPESPVIRAFTALGNGGTYRWDESHCPAGTMPKAFRAYSAYGAYIGEYKWSVKCCKVKVSYDN